ncbi:unnamed protein product, partial [Eretmochelys imbricata]
MVIVRKYVRKLVLALNHYSDRNGEAWYLVNNVRARVSEVERNPDVLAYPVLLSKRGKSSAELFYEALRGTARTPTEIGAPVGPGTALTPTEIGVPIGRSDTQTPSEIGVPIG